MKKQIIFLTTITVCTLSNAMVRQSMVRALRPSGLSGTTLSIAQKLNAQGHRPRNLVRPTSDTHAQATILKTLNAIKSPEDLFEFRKLVSYSKEYQKLEKKISDGGISRGFAGGVALTHLAITGANVYGGIATFYDQYYGIASLFAALTLTSATQTIIYGNMLITNSGAKEKEALKERNKEVLAILTRSSTKLFGENKKAADAAISLLTKDEKTANLISELFDANDTRNNNTTLTGEPS